MGQKWVKKGGVSGVLKRGRHLAMVPEAFKNHGARTRGQNTVFGVPRGVPPGPEI